MKRKPPSDPEPDHGAPRVARSRRALTEEEHALWEAVTVSTRPLKQRHRAVRADKVAARPAPAPTAKSPVVAAPVRSEPAVPRAKSPPPLVPLGRRERAQLSRGRKDIDARLDLHGMTQARAHRALQNFLARASEDGLTFVLVITGKGRTGETERGVLRRQVPEWLSQSEFRAFVVGFEEAHIGHGGGGALYVRIRRRALRGR